MGQHKMWQEKAYCDQHFRELNLTQDDLQQMVAETRDVATVGLKDKYDRRRDEREMCRTIKDCPRLNKAKPAPLSDDEI